MTTRILRLPEVTSISGLSRSTVLRYVSRGEFPKPINILGSRAIGWVSDEIDAWVKHRIEEARAPA